NILLVHYSMGWKQWPDFLNLPDRKILVYHNITPAEYFTDVSPEAAILCQKGRSDLAALSGFFSAAIADSNFNADELRLAGFQNVVAIPPLVDFGAYESTASSGVDSAQPPCTVDWLFVGRISPNKRQDDVIRAFGFYQKHIEPASRLFLVGSAN